MSAVYLSEKFFNINITANDLSKFLILIFVIVTLVGFMIKVLGIYDTETYVTADINPVEKEILEAARIIKRWENDQKQIRKKIQ